MLCSSRSPFVYCLERAPSLRAAGSDRFAWAATVATLAAWPAGELTQPVIERRLWRPGARGDLRDLVLAGLHDHVGIVTAEEAARDLDELLRPLRHARALRPPIAARRRSLTSVSFLYVAELRLVNALIPEGRSALPTLFADLICGLAALPGPVALSLAVAPPDRPPAEQEEDDPDDPDAGDSPAAGNSRRVRFRLRLCASVPIPATLRARAEALCLSRRPQSASWRTALTGEDVAAMDRALRAVALSEWDGTPDPLVRSAVAAFTLALPEPPPSRTPRHLEGRPVAGPLPVAGAPLGRVRRPDGRAATWRLGWDERRHHSFLAGASGCGKSTTMLRLILDDVAAGRMVVLVDPHGDLADDVSAILPASVRIDPRVATTEPLDLLDADPRRAAAHLLGAVTEVWPEDFAGPVWQRGISLALRTLAARPGGPHTTLAELERYLVDPVWRAKVIDRLRPGPLKAEADHESASWRRPPSGDSSLVNWMAGKLTPLTRGPGAALFADAPRRPLEHELTDGTALIVTLPIGLLGAQTARLAGRMFLTRLTTAIAAQGTLPPERRREISVLVDEAHLLAGPALAGLFAQARKFAASLTAATQSPGQLAEHLSGVLTNAQMLLLGRLPAQEAQLLRSRLGEHTASILPTLPRHHLIAATEDHDPAQPPVVLTPIPVPAKPDQAQRDAVQRSQLAGRLARDLGHVLDRREHPADIRGELELALETIERNGSIP